ncbi:hypothetical protein N9D23_10260 [Rubripirellula sp.]|jgi:hypothetical protein|nr:hypothetical protein [Planctomycetaceae bacterium]MDA9858496.1 hypothetical protein [Rubripirellula sp.]
MTQMLLFDAPASQTSFSVAASPVAPRTEPVVAESASAQVPSKQEGGLHHMGDLARLVLLRYELVAKRRARRAARLSAARLSTASTPATSLSASSLPAVST